MAITINFPASPVVNDLYSFGVKTWKWDGVAWNMLGAGLSGREILTAPKSYFVRTDGSDSNDGSANTSGKAFLTIQKAVDVVAALDVSIYDVTIEIADGTYTAGALLKKVVGAGGVTIRGNTTTPANVIISVTSGHCFYAAAVTTTFYTIEGIKLQTTTSGWGVVATGGSRLSIGAMNFGACASGHLYLDTGGVVSVKSSYAISGTAPVHVQASYSSFVCYAVTITITGTPNFSVGYVYATSLSNVFIGNCTFVGSATGVRYTGVGLTVLSANGAGVSAWPGSAGGTLSSGSQYL